MKNLFLFLTFFLILSSSVIEAQIAVTPIVYPQYCTDSTTGARLPYVFRAKITGLTANTLYRFYSRAASAAIDGVNAAGGSAVFIKPTGNFTYSTNPAFGGPGAGSDTMRTNALGEVTNWFAFEPTRGNNARFNAGNYVHARIFLQLATGGGAPTVLTVADSIQIIALGNNTSNSTGVYSTSLAPAKDIVFLYDNVAGTGRPLTGSWLETDGLNFKSGNGAAGSPNATSYPAYYRNFVDTIAATWGSFIPNNLSTGLTRIERRNLSDGLIAWANTDADGIWDMGSVNTVNASSGLNALSIAADDAPLVNVPPKIYFINSTHTIAENAGIATISVGLKFPSSNSTSVDIIYKSGSATSGSDYSFTTQTIIFPANSTTPKSVTLNITNDGSPEAPETVIFGLSNLTNSATAGSPAFDTLIIIDDDAPYVGFNTASGSGYESTTSVNIPVSIQFPNTNVTSVNIAVSGGTATLGSDFTFSNQTLTFPANSTTIINVPLAIINDAISEADETIIFTLTNATNGAVLGASSYTYTITNDDITPTITFITPTTQMVKENVGNVTLRVRLTNPTLTATSITISAVGGNATSGLDYLLSSNTITFPANTSSTINYSLPITDDNLVEGTETIVLRLTNPSNPVFYTNEYDTVTITDNDVPYYTVSQINKHDGLGIADSTSVRCELHGVVYGPNIRPGGYQFFIHDRTGGIQVLRTTGTFGGYMPQDKDSVVVKGDIQQANGQLQITNLDTVYKVGTGSHIAPKVISSYSEANEGEYVTLQYCHLLNTTQWPAAAGNAAVTIVDQNNKLYTTQIFRQTDIDSTQPTPYWFHISGILAQNDATIPWDSLYYIIPLSISDYEIVYPKLSFAAASDSVIESVGLDSIEVNLQWAARTATSATVAFTGGSATYGQDFNFTSTTVNYPAGFAVTAKQKIGLIIIDDATPEGDESVLLSILGPSNNAVASAPSVHTLVIRYNDGAGNGIHSSNQSNLISIFPNPTHGILNVKTDLPYYQASLLDMHGRVVASTNTLALDVQDVANGIYLLRVETSLGFKSLKVVVE